MWTHLADFIKDTPQGREADQILRACVHCGFCLATCPTYQVLGDELDSPRGRIYLMKQMLEGQPVTERTRLHLDRCLTCRSCETTCPSGVRYGTLVDIGRAVVEQRAPRKPANRAMRYALRKMIAHGKVFDPLFKMGRAVRPLMPQSLKKKVVEPRPSGPWPAPRHARKMLNLDGCVQPSLAPNVNSATARVLDRLGISLIRAERAGCCGAVSYHLNAQEEGLDYARRNIDAWWPYIEQGIEAIVVNASGCGTMVHEYDRLLRLDPVYAEKAARVSELFRDVGQVVGAEKAKLDELLAWAPPASPKVVAFHAPCSLQHGLKLKGLVEPTLAAAGFQLTYVRDAHLCCGSAGTYSILHPNIAQRLLKDRLEALEAGNPEVIATANIGCLTHLESGTIRPVLHWIELLDERLDAAAGTNH
jgi:glycolate oxidase iron-sulfur subunit